jgi:pimeloyl-ACP methyl ester carboxylesterase
MTERPTVALVHGWPVTDVHWRRLSPALRAAGYDVLEVSLPGLGAPAPVGGTLDKRSLADHLLGRLGPGPHALVGHDWGGTVAALAAGAAPERAWALVLEEEILPGVDVALEEPGAATYPRWHGPLNREPGMAEGLFRGRSRELIGAFLQQSAGPLGLEPAALEAYLDAYSADDAFADSLKYYRTPEADLRAVEALRTEPTRVPTLAVGGAYGMGSAVARGLRDLAVNVEAAVLPASGHYPAEQEPEGFAAHVLEFLGRHAPR